MGLGKADVKLNLELWQRGFFRNIKSVMEMGSQELHIELADFEKLVQVAGVPNYRKEDFADLAHWPGHPRCSSKPFYKLIGVEDYSCIDLGGEHGAILHDLNNPFEDSRLYGQYDLVTDYGTNEHVFNTTEAYRTMHRLLKQQGIMVVHQCVYHGNGYYTYDSSFFEGIAAANNYKILFSSYVIGDRTSGNQFHVPLAIELLELVDWAKVSFIGICYVMQKQSESSDFNYPYQGQFLADIQGHYGYQLQFLPDPPSRTYLPLERISLRDIESTPVKDLQMHVFNRVFKYVKLKLKL